ncbi:MAG TPA: phosphoribosylformylglycinamidine synthase, partial [Gammaproteobacteria bacterium]|nr:phosphoribosylformylglycinamidine synthase [Gammaproteobacteria bacterium]
GGLSNAVIELIAQGGVGAHIDLRQIPNAEPSMTPLEIWCNEAQERYVLAIEEDKLGIFDKVAKRERCPYAVIGTTTSSNILEVYDPLFNAYPVQVPISLMLEGSPKLLKIVDTYATKKLASKVTMDLKEALEQIIQFPAVADKTFLITIADRSVGGLVHRDQMVGPWQVPVADCAITLRDFQSDQGEAMAMGERSPLGVLNPKASVRMSIAEALTNILAADIEKLSDIKLSCNWMAACNDPEEDNFLFHAVDAVGKEMCPQLGIAIPVGKDSLSMRMRCGPTNQEEVKAPLSLIVSAFAPVKNIHASLTPELSEYAHTLWFLDLARGQKRLGSSCLQQMQNNFGDETPDVDDVSFFKNSLLALIELKNAKVVLAYHDRSDGGLWTSLLEMAFASKKGLTIDLTSFMLNKKEAMRFLLNEELGVVLQIDEKHSYQFEEIISKYKMKAWCKPIASIHDSSNISVVFQQETLYENSRTALHVLWSKVSFELQKIRDNERCALEAYAIIEAESDPGLQATHVSFSPIEPMFRTKPKVAILREQGVNGQREMAHAFMTAGFEAFDVTMTDLLTERFNLNNFQVLAACGGFSYGDVLGAGLGWANAILFHEKLLEMFVNFFNRSDTLTLGVCNGCQMLSFLKNIIPGASCWPKFVQNQSQQFEARLSLVEISRSSSLWFRTMEGSRLPIVVSHGEGKVYFERENHLQHLQTNELINLQFIDPNNLLPTEYYPYNPNGSQCGITAISSEDGRATIMMPHPERVVRVAQMSWAPKHWQDKSPWQQLFYNAYWVLK